MIRPSLLRLSSAVALVGLFALTGCSGDKKSGADGAKPEEGPLTKIMNAAWGDYDQEAANKEQIEVENLVAECMAAEGFEYTPQDYSSMNGTMVSSEDFEDQNTKEWVTKNGYGMSMHLDMTEEPTDGETQEEWVDPNADYVASLSESEMTAFYEALYGVQPEMTEEEMETYEYSWEDSGCQGSASHEISGDADDIFTDPKFEDLMESMSELYTAGENDPRMVELNGKWSDCMADAGYSFATSMDAMNSVSEAQNELYNVEGEMTEEYTGPSDEAIAEFRELELSTALADFTCKESVDMIKVSQEVTFELEEAFVKDNKAALDEFVAAVQDSRK